ncbi:Hypothetical_protein [Hexamita inflata]|uniref:Hypothetical_protein n=1 Tax=Hexamita inflata TaxID=28002 RepID=A0AA86V331_9EUKA|nr:Hypothetical protein HINF_LOCUS61966 [Hexamita inflata]
MRFKSCQINRQSTSNLTNQRAEQKMKGRIYMCHHLATLMQHMTKKLFKVRTFVNGVKYYLYNMYFLSKAQNNNEIFIYQKYNRNPHIRGPPKQLLTLLFYFFK